MNLTTTARNKLPSSTFAFPAKRSFPLSDASHARNALSRAHFLAPDKQTELRRKVHKKFPGIGKAHAMAQALKGGL